MLEIKRECMESLQESDWDAIDEEYDVVHIYVLPGEIKDGKTCIKSRIMELNITLKEYQEKTGIPSPRITPASSVQIILNFLVLFPSF